MFHRQFSAIDLWHYLLNPSTYGHGTASLDTAITGVYKRLLKCGNIFIPFGAVLVCHWTHPILAQLVHTNICRNFILLAVVGIFSHLVWETIIKISCQLRTLHCCSSRSEVQFKWKDAWHSRGLSPATNLNLRTSRLLSSKVLSILWMSGVLLSNGALDDELRYVIWMLNPSPHVSCLPDIINMRSVPRPSCFRNKATQAQG